MNNTSGIYLHSQTALSSSGNMSLKEGSFVSVRILKNLGPGLYTVSFAGGRFTLKSNILFTDGEVFRARLHIQNGNVVLEPVKLAESRNSQPLILTNFNGESSAASSLLTSLGLVPDEINKKLISLMMQNGSRLDPQLLMKARKLLSKHGGKLRASELSLILEEKGIDSDSSALDELMNLLEENGSDENSEKQFMLSEQAGSKESFDEINDEVKNFITSVFEGMAGEKAGALTLFNQLNEKSSLKGQEKSWIIVPFDFITSGLKGRGSFSLLLNRLKKTTEKLLIHFAYDGKKLKFALLLNEGKVRKIVFSSRGEERVNPEKMQDLLKKFSDSDGKLPELEYDEYDAMSDFGTESFLFQSVEGFV